MGVYIYIIYIVHIHRLWPIPALANRWFDGDVHQPVGLGVSEALGAPQMKADVFFSDS